MNRIKTLFLNNPVTAITGFSGLTGMLMTWGIWDRLGLPQAFLPLTLGAQLLIFVALIVVSYRNTARARKTIPEAGRILQGQDAKTYTNLKNQIVERLKNGEDRAQIYRDLLPSHANIAYLSRLVKQAPNLFALNGDLKVRASYYALSFLLAIHAISSLVGIVLGFYRGGAIAMLMVFIPFLFCGAFFMVLRKEAAGFRQAYFVAAISVLYSIGLPALYVWISIAEAGVVCGLTFYVASRLFPAKSYSFES